MNDATTKTDDVAAIINLAGPCLHNNSAAMISVDSGGSSLPFSDTFTLSPINDHLASPLLQVGGGDKNVYHSCSKCGRSLISMGGHPLVSPSPHVKARGDIVAFPPPRSKDLNLGLTRRAYDLEPCQPHQKA